MMTAKLFEKGRSPAVRLPKEYRFSGDDVAFTKVGEAVILLPKDERWAGFLRSFEMFSEGFMDGERKQHALQEHESL